ncbi:glycosyltransferase [Winogradskyella sp.]|uniref:glycosyltransferase n=1 Tax=Winogradskyella sp. TaxID=1883156 RepID=UPI0025CD09D0|nr:glycosyltransferase [Winogradskyella sp.]
MTSSHKIVIINEASLEVLNLKANKKPNNIALSVIICAKNEAENLKKNLPKMISQDYKDFEIVLINDSSSDETLEIFESFESFAKTHSLITIVNVKSIEQFWGNKKYALTLGIKATKNEFLVFTDADCEPSSQFWLEELSSHFSNQKSIILGFGAYKKVKYSFLNMLIRFETLMTAVQYFSYAKAGIPYMGVGRNLAYRKELFFNNGGFKKHILIKSEGDDLFINEIANAKNTSVCISKNSFTISEPKRSFKDWTTQKRIHISTSKHYKPLHKFLLGLFYISQLMFWGFAFVLLSVFFQWEIVLGILCFRILLQWVVVGKSAYKLESRDLAFAAPFLEVFLISFQLIIFSANLISKPKHWK